MNMTQKVLTKIFESLLNTAAQAPTDDIVNRDGISLMKQGFDKPFRSIEGSPKERDTDLIGVGLPAKPVTLTTISEQLARIEGKLSPIHDVVVNPTIPKGKGMYDVDACRLWYIRYLRTAKPGSSEPEMDGDESSKTLDRQKAELANEYRQEQIENLRLRRMVLSKQYAPITVLSAVLLL